MKYFLFVFFACLSVGQGVFAQAPAVKKYCTTLDQGGIHDLYCADPEGKKNFVQAKTVAFRRYAHPVDSLRNRVHNLTILLAEASVAGFELVFVNDVMDTAIFSYY